MPYRFVLPGPTISPAEAAAILVHLARIIASYRGFVVASGSLAPGVPEQFYAALAARVRALGAKLIIDTHGAPLRAAASEPCRDRGRSDAEIDGDGDVRDTSETKGAVPV